MEEKRSSKRRKTPGRRVSDETELTVPIHDDRRTTPRPDRPSRRSQTDRRLPVDRRIAPDAFDADARSTVENMILKAGILIACPQCNEQLTLGPVIHKTIGSQREVRCARCRQSIVVDNLP
jgi:hypothetical protein